MWNQTGNVKMAQFGNLASIYYQEFSEDDVLKTWKSLKHACYRE